MSLTAEQQTKLERAQKIVGRTFENTQYLLSAITHPVSYTHLDVYKRQVLTLLGKMEAEDADTCTILAGEGYSDEDLVALVAKIEEAYDELEVDAQRGEQPLYPIVFSVE